MLKRNNNKVKFENSLNYFLKGNRLFSDGGQAIFDLPHLILTFAQKSKRGGTLGGGQEDYCLPPLYATAI